MATRRNFIDVQNDAKYRLENFTPVTSFENLSTSMTLINILSNETEKLYDEAEYLFSINDITRAYGRDLDNIGRIIGSERGDATTSNDMTYTNFYFYLDTRLGIDIGTLIDRVYPTSTHYNIRQRLEDQGYIDNKDVPTQLKLPRGMYVSSDDRRILYTTVEDAYLTNDSNEVYVPVIATATGSGQNVGANVIIKHSLNEVNIIKDLSKYILCTNRFPITNGSNTVSDDDYRYNMSISRINLGANEVAIRQAALSVPGVRNVLFERARFGNGTFNLIVEGVSPLVSEGLVTTVKERVQSIVGGDSVYVHRPEYIGVELNLDLITEVGTDTDLLRETVRNDIISYINDTTIGGRLIWNQLVDIIIREGVIDFVLSYYKFGEYDIFNKINLNQIVLRPSNQGANYNEKFYIDAGLCSICVREQG